MKYLCFLFIISCFHQAFTQDCSFGYVTSSFMDDQYSEGYVYFTPNPDFLDISKGAKLISISSSDVYFQKTYLVNKQGETLSAGYMPSSYFLPNDNLIVISGHTNTVKDSFNPYGAYDMASMIVLATFNNFISRIKRSRR